MATPNSPTRNAARTHTYHSHHTPHKKHDRLACRTGQRPAAQWGASNPAPAPAALYVHTIPSGSPPDPRRSPPQSIATRRRRWCFAAINSCTRSDACPRAVDD